MEEVLQQKAIAFLIAISRIINSMKMYSPNHPVVKQGGEEACELLTELMTMTPQVTIGRKEGKLLLLGKRLPDDTPAAGRFQSMLEQKNIRSVILDRGATNDELIYFLELIGKRPDDVLDGDVIKPELLQPLNRIRLNEVRYAAVGADGEFEEGEGGGGGGRGSMVADAMLSKLFADELANPTVLSNAQLAAIFDRMAPHSGGGSGEGEGDGGQARGYFEETFSRVGAERGLAGMRETLLGTVLSMTPEAQEALFGRVVTDGDQADDLLKTFSIERRAALVAADIERGAEGDIAEAVDALVQTDEEVVELAELICKNLPGNEQKKRHALEKLFRSLHGGGDVELPQAGLVYIADSDDESCREYTMLLQGTGVEHVRFTSGADVLKMIGTRKPDVLILDVVLEGRTGLEVLATLDRERNTVPVILCTAMKGVRDEFEVQMYPEMQFMDKPFKPVKMLQAIRSRLPAPESLLEGVKQTDSDLERARKLQEKLVPDLGGLTDLPGYELSAYYNSCLDVGGDYLDLIPLDETHIGIVVADVSGKGITGAMVMVMMRSIVRMLAHSTRSPRELLTRVNELINRDVSRGMFVTAVYGVLDLPACTMTLAFAGHNPGVIYDGNMGLALMTELGGIGLGLVKGEIFRKSINEQTVQLRPGDAVMLYTDGVTECLDVQHEEFGEERLRKLVNLNGKRGAGVLTKSLVAALERHQGQARQHDDVTILTLRCLQAADDAPETRRIEFESIESGLSEAISSGSLPAVSSGPHAAVADAIDAPGPVDTGAVTVGSPDESGIRASDESGIRAAAALSEPLVDEATEREMSAESQVTHAIGQDTIKRVQIRRILTADPENVTNALLTLDVSTLVELARIAEDRPIE